MFLILILIILICTCNYVAGRLSWVIVTSFFTVEIKNNPPFMCRHWSLLGGGLGLFFSMDPFAKERKLFFGELVMLPMSTAWSWQTNQYAWIHKPLLTLRYVMLTRGLGLSCSFCWWRKHRVVHEAIRSKDEINYTLTEQKEELETWIFRHHDTQYH